MRAFVCEAPGAPPALREVPAPEPGDGEVLVAVRAAGVGSPDGLMVDGRYQVRPPTPFVIGCEFSGIVAKTGPGVTRWATGDGVMGTCFTGALAEFVVVPAWRLMPVPDQLPLADAAAAPVAARTAVQALVIVGELGAGDQVVVLGAAGGVGHMCVQVAHLLGARVVAVASDAGRRERCVGLGAAIALDPRAPDIKDLLRQHTGGGADVVVDPVGGRLSEPALGAPRWGARFVVVGFASGDIPAIPLNLILLKGVQVRGFETRTLGQHLPDRVREGDALLDDLFRRGLRPHIDVRFPLDRAQDALSALAARRVFGKVVVDVATDHLSA
jgi:NADPH2:quinone reductase